MPLITVDDVSIRFRGPALLDGVSCTIDAGQKIGLLGRNGAGKTTLLKMLGGEVQPDDGRIIVTPGVRISQLSQYVPTDQNGTVQEMVMQAFAGGNPDGQSLELWEQETKAEQVISRMLLEPEARFETLSAGMKRRVLLAKAIVVEPDVLLLDEPTNHLDIPAIAWLEKFLVSYPATVLFVTHDRAFLQSLAKRILEIDRGRIFDWSCDYQTFLKRKQQALEAEDKQNALFDKRLAEEEAWIRKGIKARRTRNEGRVRALKAMRTQFQERRSKVGTSRLNIQQAQRSGNLTIDMEDVSFSYDNCEPSFENFTTSIMRGDKVGIIGPNGIGKSTLLKVMLGELEPTSGKMKLGTNLEIAYFDQLKSQLDPEATVIDNVGEGSDRLLINGNPMHVLGYLADFLFEPARARTEVKFLSGGERNRILLAKLFSKPANVIVMDEPTNDLDTETLELLESKLVEFSGTVLIVSHDRQFLNNVVSSSIVFEPDGLKEYAGGYDDWLRQSPTAAEQVAPVKKAAGRSVKKAKTAEPAAAAAPESKRKLSYKEKRELESLPQKIESLEAGLVTIHESMADPDFYKKSGAEIASAQEKVNSLQSDLEIAFARWEELESLA